jgi:hypothetical protein
VEQSCLAHNKQLIENSGYFTILRGVNYMLLFIILPCPVRALRSEKPGHAAAGY